ncbi:hypothetical protein H6775_03225 [Candidatus Nomurabacteria bacterium]|nr:hypothetical protein [Candidatus Nomurabacteria bacterium]
MKKNGQGWQHTTYDLGNGRVYKKFNSRTKRFLTIFKDLFFSNDKSKWKIFDYVIWMEKVAKQSFDIYKNLDLDKKYFANAEIKDGLNYEQDKLIPLGDYFKTHTEEEGRFVIDEFVDFNKFLISENICDKSFNITKNFGIYEDGTIALIDIGELYIGDMVKRQINLKIWQKHYVLNFLPLNLQSYFLEKMEEIVY